MNTKQYYIQARQSCYPANHAMRTAKALAQWERLEAQGKVRLRAEAEEERYMDVYGEPEAYTDGNGRRVTARQAKKELIDLLDNWGCWIVVAEWFDGQEWHNADSIGMCSGYKNPLDWRENWCVPDLMRSAIECMNVQQEECQWESECALAQLC